MDMAIELIKLASVGIIAGLFSLFISHRDHRQKKWWELRVDAYRGAIEALSDIVYYFDKHFTAHLEDRELPDAFKKKMEAYWDEAYPRVRRLADSGAFLFSDRANIALKAFIRDDNEDSYFEMLDNNLHKAKTCLTELVACSKEDLRLQSGWFDRWIN